MNFDIDVSMAGLVTVGFGLSFGIWAISRAIRIMFELANSRSGHIKSE